MTTAVGIGSASVGTAAGAAFTALASHTAVLLVNNKGDIGKTLRQLESSETGKMLLTAALTAGLTAKVGKVLNLPAQPSTFVQHMQTNLTHSAVSALSNVAVNGGDLRDALEKALLSGAVTAVHGSVSNQIKGLEGQYLLHKISHALAGCAAAAQKQECEAGAIGAAVGEIVAEQVGKNPNMTQQDIIGASKLAAGVVAAYTGHAVNTATAMALNGSDDFDTFHKTLLNPSAITSA